MRGRQVSTVVTMVADLVEKGRIEYRVEWVSEERHRQIEEAVRRIGTQWLRPLREAARGDYVLPDQAGGGLRTA